METAEKRSVHDAPVVGRARLSAVEGDAGKGANDVFRHGTLRSAFLLHEQAKGCREARPPCLRRHFAVPCGGRSLREKLKERDTECGRKVVERLEVQGLGMPFLDSRQISLCHRSRCGHLCERQPSRTARVLQASSNFDEIKASVQRRTLGSHGTPFLPWEGTNIWLVP